MIAAKLLLYIPFIQTFNADYFRLFMKRELEESLETKCGPGGCHSFQSKKKRYCKMVVRSGEKFCGAHVNEDESKEKRVKCPHCGCLLPANKLEKHMKKCNKVKEAAIIPKYYSRDINMENINTDEDKSKVDSMKLAEFETSTIQEVLELLKNVNDPIEDEIIETELNAMTDIIKELKDLNAKKALRHTLQQSYILEKMNQKDLLKDDRCYIELGAGKGGLTERLNHYYKNLDFVIVDRATSRVKKERKIEENSFERVKIDIKDFDINMITSSKSHIGIAKHLCGRFVVFM